MKLNQYPKPDRKGFKVKEPWIVRRQLFNQWKYDFSHKRYHLCVVEGHLSFRDFKHCQKYRNGISWSNAAWLLSLAW